MIIEAHFINSVGVYLRTIEVDSLGPQPAGVVYGPKPVIPEGHVAVRSGNDWVYVLDSEKPEVTHVVESLEQVKERLMVQIEKLESETINKGVPYDFGAPYGVLHVQLRDGDRTNLIGIRMKCLENENYRTTFRTYENINVPLDATSGYDITEHGLNGYITIKEAAWSLKDAVTAATTLEELPVLPEALI